MRYCVGILYYVVVVFGLVILGQLDLPDGVCLDKAPKEAPFGCYRYAKLGLCHGIADQFCRNSCKRCDCSEAEALFCDVQGLMAFKNSFWQGSEYLKSWRGIDPCDWEFITCDPTINRVMHVNFYLKDTIIQNSMSGSLVPELSKLRHLQILSVWSVYLNGELPVEYSVLNKLMVFTLYDTVGVNGTLPAQYSLWTSIMNIYTHGNQITGTIPVEFSLWKSIVFFNIDNNSLYGRIPPNFSTWKQVDFISVMFNKMTGTLPMEFSKLNWITTINFISNKLTGSLPKQFCSFEDDPIWCR